MSLRWFVSYSIVHQKATSLYVNVEDMFRMIRLKIQEYTNFILETRFAGKRTGRKPCSRCQWFSGRDGSASQRTSDNVWGHFWVSQLGEGCYWCLVESGRGPAKYPTTHRTAPYN